MSGAGAGSPAWLLGDLLTTGSLVPLLRWWVWLLLLGVAFAPIGRALFPRSLDGGYLVGKLLAVLVLAYAVWLGALLGWVRVVQGGVLLGTIALAVPVLLSLRRPVSVAPGVLRFAALGELLFLALLVAGCVLRSINPALATAEKFMDFGFVNAILHATSFPPPDPWFAGLPINYYYFGHFVTAVLVAATGVPPAVGFNLMVATVLAATFTAAYALVADATLRAGAGRRLAVGAGLLAGLLLGAGGNLHPFVFGFLRPLLAGAGQAAAHAAPYAYPLATRFVGLDPPTADRVITEFPAYSFAVADLHAHVLDLPFVLAFLWVAFHALCDDSATRVRRWGRGALLALLLGTFWMTNSWDAPMYALVLGGLLLFLGPAAPVRRRIARAALQLGAIGGAALALSLPFTLRFEPFGRGFGRVEAGTPAWQLAVLYGWQAALAVALVALLIRRRRAEAVDRFFLVVLAAAGLFVLIPEVVYLKDGILPPYVRANTVFKFGYQAFVLLTLTAAFACARLLLASSSAARRAVTAGLLAMVCVPPLGFAVFAVKGELAYRLGGAATLDGLALLRQRNPEDAAMARWLDQHARGDGYLLEAEGASFSYAGRMAVLTGIPSVIGWTPHQVLWRPRGGWRERSEDVARFYGGADLDEARAILRRYGVGYVVIGEFERLRYQRLDPGRIASLGRVVFRSGESEIVRIPPAERREPPQ